MQFGSDYSYCGVDSATERLNEELRALGGGSAQSSRMALVAFYASPSSSASSGSNTHTGKDSILTALPSSLALRDPFASLSSVGGKAILRSEQFPCTPIPLQNALQSPDSLNITHEAVGSVLQGFNKCIFSFGEKGSGKTRLLFHDGRNESPEAAGNKESKSLVEALLRRLYQQLAIKVGIRDHRVAISCYFVRGNSVIDLLQKHEQKPYTPVQNMRLVDCPTLSIALATVKAARGGLDETSEQGRGHFFLRILVFQTRTEDPIDEGVPSSLFIVDLLGAAPTSGQAFNALTKEERIHRRVNALHLQTLSKVLLQMAKASEEALSSSSVRDSFCSSASILSAYETDASSAQVTSARDSTLTATLCPILQGNVAVSVLMFLVDAEEHFAVTKQTLRSLSCVPHISCAAYTASAVRLSTLGIQSDHALLPLQSFNSNCTQKSKSRGKGRDWSVHFGELMEEYQGALASAIQSLPCPPTKDAEGARENQGQNYPVAPLRTVVDEKIREKSFQLSSEALLQELADLRVQMAEERAVHQDSEEELKASAAQCELKTYDLELEIVRLRALNRSLSKEQGLEEIYNSFESELDRSKQEVEALRGQLEQRRPASRDLQLVSTNSSISAAGRALQRLKKEDDERLALRRENEALKKRERQQAVAMRLREDLARKLSASHQRVTHLTADNRHLKEALNKLTCDYHALREEFELVFAAHAQLRMERARTMEELAILRAAAREADAERRRFHKLDRFVAKHSSSSSNNTSTFIEGSTTANCSSSSRKDLAVHGLSGNEDAMYSRMEDGPPPSLRIEEAHLTLQRELSQREPTLLPLLRDLMQKIDIDRRELTEKQGKLAQQRPNSPHKGKRP